MDSNFRNQSLLAENFFCLRSFFSPAAEPFENTCIINTNSGGYLRFTTFISFG
jgi:hypothetical protein